MRHTLYLALFLLLLVPAATATVTHNIDIEGADARIQTSFTLESNGDKEYNVFKASWELPNEATLHEIRDSEGEITEYERENEQLTFETHSGSRRSEEPVQITYTLPDRTEELADDLSKAKIQLPGFPDKKTQAQVTTPSPVLGLQTSHGYQRAIKDQTANVSGNGPLNLQVSYTSRKGSYDNFILWGDANLTTSDEYMPLAHAITGLPLPFRKLAIIVLPENEYEEELDDAWYAGYYEGAGIIYIKESETDKDTFPGLVIHEAMHAFNQQPMSWVNTRSTLLDEGTASFAEYLTNKQLNVRQSKLFSDETTWEAPCTDQPSRDCRYTRQPRGTLDDLVEYYSDSTIDIFSWNPKDESSMSDDTSLRTFGYAYGDLMVRRYAIENGLELLPQLYRNFRKSDPVSSTAGYKQRVQQLFSGQITPCRRDQRQKIEDCVEEANTYDPAIPENIEIEGTLRNLTIEKQRTSDETDQKQTEEETNNITNTSTDNTSETTSPQEEPPRPSNKSSPRSKSWFQQLAQTFMQWLGRIIS